MTLRGKRATSFSAGDLSSGRLTSLTGRQRISPGLSRAVTVRGFNQRAARKKDRSFRREAERVYALRS